MATTVRRGYPSDWDSRRKQVYQRDGYQCQNCGALGGHRGDTELHAHHVVPKSDGGTHSLSNLTTLCRSCHSDVHGHPVGGRSTTTNSSATVLPTGARDESEDSDSSQGMFDHTTRELKLFGPFYIIGFVLLYSGIAPWVGGGVAVVTFVLKDLRKYRQSKSGDS